ncbi:hypothetical protein [Apibacter adventoris]|uniref:hypothetical protein n=1 Tax=Apibacter adventoris TaxID=1679466 RepID=UPI000CF5EC34|nr:hypothetical protein [Apibacter adventoris]PQL93253.1 hypothetical protein C4S76_09295 [Apibacter adventoris]
MKKLFIISTLLLVFAEAHSLHAQKTNCALIDGVLKSKLAQQAYNAIKETDMEKRLYCSDNRKYLFGFKNNTKGNEELQIGFYYMEESVENNTYSQRKEFTSMCKKIYKQIKGKDKKKPLVSFRLFFITNSGTYAMGKITYNEKGQPWSYTNEKHIKTGYGGYNIFPGINRPIDFSYTSDIIY